MPITFDHEYLPSVAFYGEFYENFNYHFIFRPGQCLRIGRSVFSAHYDGKKRNFFIFSHLAVLINVCVLGIEKKLVIIH